MISQNEKQLTNGETAEQGIYSYTNYDYLGRITEVGQLMADPGEPMTDVISKDPVALDYWIANHVQDKEQITHTVYDIPYGGFTSSFFNQRNLRNRVSFTTYSNGSNPAQFNSGSFYTYDVHGNVDTLL